MTRFILTRTDDEGTETIGIYNKFKDAEKALDNCLDYETDPDCSYSIEEWTPTVASIIKETRLN